MSKVATRTQLAAALALTLLPFTLSSAAGAWTAAPSLAASASCNQLNSFGTATGTDGSTNGQPGAFQLGDRVTLTVTLGTATTSNVTIVGNSTGTPVLAGPLIGAGTISYDVPAVLPAGSIGIGYFVNSTTPTQSTVNVTIACADGPSRAVPVWAPLTGVIAALGLLGFGVARLRRRR